MTTYEKQASKFAAKTGTKLAILSSDYKPMWNEKQSRYVFKCKLSRKGKSYTFEFGQSIACGGEEPTLYSIISCLQKYDVGSFEDFCSEFGYSEDSRTAERTYNAVCKEFAAVERLFSDVIDQLQEIN